MGRAFCFGIFLGFDCLFFLFAFFLFVCFFCGGFDFYWCVLLQHSLFFICLGSNPWPCTWSIKRHRNKRFVPFLHPIECQRGLEAPAPCSGPVSADTSEISSLLVLTQGGRGELGWEWAVSCLQSSPDSCGGWFRSGHLFSFCILSLSLSPLVLSPDVLEVVGQTVVTPVASLS